MRYWVGFDVGKAFHWVCVLDGEGEEVLSRRVEAAEEDLEAACSEIERMGGERTVGLDLIGGPATLLEAVLLERGEKIFHVPGVAVNRARDAYPGEAKTDAKDARVIADQLRLRRGSLHEVRPGEESTAELRLLVAHRRDLLQDQTRRAARLREVLLGLFPGLEAELDFKREGALLAVTKVASPASARRLGEGRLFRWLKGRGVRKAEDLAGRVLAAAKAQRRELPALCLGGPRCRDRLGDPAHEEAGRRARPSFGGAAYVEPRGGGREEPAGYGRGLHRRVPGGGRRPFSVRLGRLVGRSGEDRPGPQGLGRDEPPAKGEARQQNTSG